MLSQLQGFPVMLHAAHLASLQEMATARWHDSSPLDTTPNGSSLLDPRPESGFEELVVQQHRANYDLWHREDEARDPLANDRAIALIKRDIDCLNQHRNNLMERLDTHLLSAVAQNEAAPLHSETPGLILDRLSILALKVFHTEEQTLRGDVDESHRIRNRERLVLLQEQRRDLAGCLANLWAEVGGGQRRFKLYRQFKMYNDPTLNPVVYGSVAQGRSK